MDKERLVNLAEVSCTHKEQQFYNERCFDILNGLELNFTRCLNCHKVVKLDAKKLENH